MMQVGAQLFTLRDYTQTAKDLDAIVANLPIAFSAEQLANIRIDADRLALVVLPSSTEHHIAHALKNDLVAAHLFLNELELANRLTELNA